MMNSLKPVESSAELYSVVVGLIHTVSAKARESEITPQSLLLEELALNSLDLVRVIMLIEDRYRTPSTSTRLLKLKRVQDLSRDPR